MVNNDITEKSLWIIIVLTSMFMLVLGWQFAIVQQQLWAILCYGIWGLYITIVGQAIKFFLRKRIEDNLQHLQHRVLLLPNQSVKSL